MGKLRDFLTRQFATNEQRAETPSPGVIPPARSEVRVTSESAMTLVSVYRAVSILSTAVGQLSVDTLRGSAPTDTPAFIRKPDNATSRSAFLESTVTSMALRGNAFWRITRNAAREVRNIEVLNPDLVQIHETETGKPAKFSVGGKEAAPGSIVHLPLLRVPGTARGLGPIQAAQNEIRGALELRNYGANWIAEGTVPNGVLSSDQYLTGEQAQEYKERFVDGVRGDEPVVLGNGLAYRPLVISPKDAQFLESRQFSTTEIARLFGLPAIYMLAAVEGNSMTYSNMEQIDIAFVRFTLMQYLREIEEALSSLLPRTTEARFNVEVLLRTDTKTRYEAHKTAIEAGIYDAEHARKIEGIR